MQAAPTPKELIRLLLDLHDLEDQIAKKKKKVEPKVVASAEKIRAKIPEPILGHHDRLRVKGKRSVAPARHGVCCGCFITLPVGERARVQLGNDINLCQTCGRYLYAEEPAAADEPPAPAPAKRGRRPKRVS